MDFNSLVFPAPEANYDAEFFAGELVWIPREHPEDTAIPCLFLQAPAGSSKVLVYFHGNAEDLCLTYELVDMLREYLNVHVVAVEYPGYGIHFGKPSAERIIADADSVFNYLVNEMEVRPRDVIVFGRSIGSGPATWLARYRSPCCLVLMSAYTSIRAVVKNIAGRLAQVLVADRFKNIDHMPYISCATFIVHGQKDTLIPFSHSQKLHEECSGPCSLHLPKEMDHNDLDYYEDLLEPLHRFLESCGISVEPLPGKEFLPVPSHLFQPPENQALLNSKGRLNKLLQKYS